MGLAERSQPPSFLGINTVLVERPLADLPGKVKLRREQDLAGGLPALHSAVGFLGLGHRQLQAHVELDLSALDPVEDVGGALDELVAGGGVVAEAGADQGEGAAAEGAGVNLSDGASAAP